MTLTKNNMAEGTAPRIFRRRFQGWTVLQNNEITHTGLTKHAAEAVLAALISAPAAPLADEVDVKLECGHTVRLHRASSAFDFPNDPLWCPTCGKWVKLHAEVIARIS